MKFKTYEKIDLVLGTLAWGLIGFVVFVVILKLLGIIHSPSVLTLENLFAGGILLELVKLDKKLDRTADRLGLLWSDFKKRKNL